MKKIINTLNAPAPIGPYSQAILSNNVLYVSGQIPLEPGSMKLIEGSLEDETTRVMENLKAVLEAAKMTFENVVKSSIFLSDMKNFTASEQSVWSLF